MSSPPMSWPHAPSKIVDHPGTYIITAGTYHKEHLFKDSESLRLLHDTLLSVAEEQGWQLQAWAVFSNHYHLVGFSPDRPNAVRTLTSKVHGLTAIELNKRQSATGRQVWYRS
ncbi:MAG: transposase [Armatimonadetes bacterium]|nr:transposase [Armatimonadota bacterium]